MRTFFSKFLTCTVLAVSAVAVHAGPMTFWSDDGWTQVASEDYVGAGGRVFPGWGGQSFDAEYLYYRVDGSTLSLGIQTGFNLITGQVDYDGHSYYSGDLALSFNGGGFDYAVDFGLKTADYDGDLVDADNNNDGIDAAGLYSVSAWNNDIYFGASAPYAMDEGTLLGGLSSNVAGQIGDSFFRTVSFDLSDLDLGSDLDFVMQWTMSCGNDMIRSEVANVSVPEPGTVGLLALGLLCLALRRRNA